MISVGYGRIAPKIGLFFTYNCRTRDKDFEKNLFKILQFYRELILKIRISYKDFHMRFFQIHMRFLEIDMRFCKNHMRFSKQVAIGIS